VKRKGECREAPAEGSVEQDRDLTNRNRIRRQSRPDELASGSKVHIRQVAAL
jgi:hypothetical protein